MLLLLLALPLITAAGEIPVYSGADLVKQKAALVELENAVHHGTELPPCEELENDLKVFVSFQPNITACPKARSFHDRIAGWAGRLAAWCRKDLPQGVKVILKQPLGCNQYGSALTADASLQKLSDKAMVGLRFGEVPKAGDPEYGMEPSPEMKRVECGIALSTTMSFRKTALELLNMYRSYASEAIDGSCTSAASSDQFFSYLKNGDPSRKYGPQYPKDTGK